MDRSRSLALALLVALAPVACGDEAPPAGPSIEWLTLRSARFIVTADAAHTTIDELQVVLAAAESLFQSIAALLGPEHTADRVITIWLDATGDVSQLQGDGSILLAPASEARGGYLWALAHELTHAFRFEFWRALRAWEWPTFAFYEEGFADFVAMRVDPGKLGFPLFGYPEDVVAGHWVVSGEGVPLGILRALSDELNTPCAHQVYPVRGSWFSFIDEVYGREAVMWLAYSEVEVTSDVTQRALGSSLAGLDAAWEAWVSARYAAVPNAEALAESYRGEIAGAAICVAGVDF